MRRLLIVLLGILLFYPTVSFGAETLPGKYKLIGDVNEALGKDQVTMVEFFNFSCGHCYKFLTASAALTRKYGKKLKHIKIPVYWEKQTNFPAIAFYLAEQKGKDEEITKSIFDANFQGGAQIFDPRVVNFIISESGIADDVRNHNDLAARVEERMALSKKYGVNETPTVILNDVIKVAPSMLGGDIGKMTENLDVIISELLKGK